METNNRQVLQLCKQPYSAENLWKLLELSGYFHGPNSFDKEDLLTSESSKSRIFEEFLNVKNTEGVNVWVREIASRLGDGGVASSSSSSTRSTTAVPVVSKSNSIACSESTSPDNVVGDGNRTDKKENWEASEPLKSNESNIGEGGTVSGEILLLHEELSNIEQATNRHKVFLRQQLMGLPDKSKIEKVMVVNTAKYRKLMKDKTFIKGRGAKESICFRRDFGENRENSDGVGVLEDEQEEEGLESLFKEYGI